MTNEGATEELLGERTFLLIFLGIVTVVCLCGQCLILRRCMLKCLKVAFNWISKKKYVPACVCKYTHAQKKQMGQNVTTAQCRCTQVFTGLFFKFSCVLEKFHNKK